MDQSKRDRKRERERKPMCLRQEDDNEEAESSRRESSKFIVYRLDRPTKKKRGRNVEEEK